MIDKRFMNYYDKDHNYIIQDLQNEEEYQVGFVNCDEDVFLKLVNEIADENEQLRKENDMLSCELSVSANKEISRNCRIAELEEENEQLKTESTMLKEHQNINCQNCQYFVSDSVSSDCLKREDIGYKGTCIDGMDLHMLAKNCPYY